MKVHNPIKLFKFSKWLDRGAGLHYWEVNVPEEDDSFNPEIMGHYNDGKLTLYPNSHERIESLKKIFNKYNVPFEINYPENHATPTWSEIVIPSYVAEIPSTLK